MAFFRGTRRIPDGLASQDSFARTLRLERGRAERSGREFSLIAFDTALGAEGNKMLDDLRAVLDARIRLTDSVGWLDQDRLGLLLPETTSHGAGKLADEVARQMAEEGWTLSHEVYVFPSKWIGGESEGDAQGEDTTKARRLDPFFAVRMPLWKRTLDIAVSVALLALLWPIMLLAAVLIRLSSSGPALFKQERVGAGGRLFTCLKFRTMRLENDASAHRRHLAELIHSDNPMNKIDDVDPRVFPFGRILRKTYIDELPQLINVARGDMSLVGPRPCLPYEAEEYLRWHARRFDPKPGMTGLWQVSGKNDVTFRQMVLLDIKYAEAMSLPLDLWILFMTPVTIVRQLFFGRKKRRVVSREEVA